MPPVSVLRTHHPAGLRRHRHAHGFVVAAMVESGGSGVRVNGTDVTLGPGDLIIVGPGRSVDPGPLVTGTVEGRAVSFATDVITTWRNHKWRSDPVLLSIVGGTGGPHNLRVPEAHRAAVLARFTDIERELQERPSGWGEAVPAQLALLLIDLARIATANPTGLTTRGDALLVAAFAVVDEAYAQPLALAGVAARVGLSPGHLTTEVRRRTRRTVQAWIVERRMSEARRLLVETDLSVQDVGAQVGIPDPSYFIRRFRHAHGVPPLRWRQAAGVLR